MGKFQGSALRRLCFVGLPKKDSVFFDTNGMWSAGKTKAPKSLGSLSQIFSADSTGFLLSKGLVQVSWLAEY